MIGKDSSGHRNVHFRESGRGFNSRATGETDSIAYSKTAVSKHSAVEHKSSNSNTLHSGSSSIRNDSYAVANTSSKASSNTESPTHLRVENSISSNLKGYLCMLKMFNSIVMLPKDSLIIPFLQLMRALALVKKGCPRIIGT